MSDRSLLEILLERQMLDASIPGIVTEFKFSSKRKWRSDFAIPDLMLLIEVEGGEWGGRHTFKEGFNNDCEKYNEAAILGYTVIRVTGSMIESEELIALDFVKRAVDACMKRARN